MYDLNQLGLIIQKVYDILKYCANSNSSVRWLGSPCVWKLLITHTRPTKVMRTVLETFQLSSFYIMIWIWVGRHKLCYWMWTRPLFPPTCRVDAGRLSFVARMLSDWRSNPRKPHAHISHQALLSRALEVDWWFYCKWRMDRKMP